MTMCFVPGTGRTMSAKTMVGRRQAKFLYVLIFTSVSMLSFLVLFRDNEKLLPRNVQLILDSPASWKRPPEYVSAQRGFLLDTPYCKIPDLDPFDISVMQKTRRRGELLCFQKKSVTYTEGSVLKLNRTKIEKELGGDLKYCQYQPIRRGTRNSDFAFVYGSVSEAFDHDILVPPEDEFMRLHCYSHSDGKIATNFHALVTPKENVEHRSDYLFKQHLKRNSPRETYNVHMIGVDSVSRLHFIRQMQQTLKFLRDELHAFPMSGYSKVADNTFVNIVPMMVGKFVHEMGWNETMSGRPFDEYPFLWKNFSKAGYRTLYAEDAPKMAIFVYAKEGFHIPPTDYYNRPLALAMETQRDIWSRDHHCVADRLETTMLLDYVTDFSRVFKAKPHFGFTFITRLTHDNLEMAAAADFAYLKFLKRFKSEGHFNNTVLIMYSDHGYRFGEMRSSYIGKVEERLPFLYLVFPPSFHKKYPALVKNLRTNARRLTTPFDVYETLKDILYFDGVAREADISNRGISLLREVPAERTCEHAHILPHWCLCLEQKPLVAHSRLASRVGTAVVDHINSQLMSVSHLCASLKLHNVSEIVQMEYNEKVLRFSDSLNDVINRTVVYGTKTEAPVVYQVTLSTLPGHALFEATIIHDTSEDIYKLGGDISRINAYSDQSLCVNNSLLKKFCFCV